MSEVREAQRRRRSADDVDVAPWTRSGNFTVVATVPVRAHVSMYWNNYAQNIGPRPSRRDTYSITTRRRRYPLCPPSPGRLFLARGKYARIGRWKFSRWDGTTFTLESCFDEKIEIRVQNKKRCYQNFVLIWVVRRRVPNTTFRLISHCYFYLWLNWPNFWMKSTKPFGWKSQSRKIFSALALKLLILLEPLGACEMWHWILDTMLDAS